MVDNINLTVNHHDKIALIGNNGSGKSTLLKIIAKELQPYAFLNSPVFGPRELRSALPDIDKMKFGFDNSALHKGKILFNAAGSYEKTPVEIRAKIRETIPMTKYQL